MKTKKKTTVKIETCQYVEFSALIPKSFGCDFSCAFSENAPFSYGDNNRTLVTASRVRDHSLDVLDCTDTIPDEEKSEFLDLLESLGETYIDIEN